MSQSPWVVLDPNVHGGSFLAAALNAWVAAERSQRIGAARPTDAVKGTIWIMDVSPTSCLLYLYDGANDLLIGSVNPTTHVITLNVPAGPALGTAAYLNVGVGANQVVQMTAAAKLPAVDGSLLTGLVAGERLAALRVYTAGATWNKPAGLTSIVVECLGGGGAGGSCVAAAASQCSMGASGGAGGWGLKRILAAALAATVTITVGAGGTPVASTAGNPGGTTSFGSHMSCAPGGGGGILPSGTGRITIGCGGGGIVTGADLAVPGGSAYIACRDNSSSASVPEGASTRYGTGGPMVLNAITYGGIAATGYGAGGSGCASVSGGGAQLGGAGSPGLVLVYEFTT